MHRFAFALLLLCGLSPLLTAQSPVVSQDATLKHEVYLLEFIGGGSRLNAAERAEITQAIANAMHADPQKWANVAAHEQSSVQEIEQNDPARNNLRREASRYNYAFKDPQKTTFSELFITERRIIDAHDPVIAIDREHTRLVTKHSLLFMKAGAEWAAEKFRYPPPRADYDAIVSRTMSKDLSSADTAYADGLAHIEQNVIYLPAYYASMTPAQRDSIFIGKRAATFHNMDDPAQSQRELTQAAGLMATYAANQQAVHSTLQAMLRSQQRSLNMLHNAAVAGSPACSVTAGEYSDRYAAGCYK